MNKKPFLLLAVVFAALLGLGQSPTRAASPKNAKVLALKFHADWCGKCKVLQPKLNSLSKSPQNKAVDFRIINVTDDTAKAKSAKVMQSLKLTQVWERYSDTAGIVVLVDNRTHKQLGIIWYQENLGQMQAKLNKALAKI